MSVRVSEIGFGLMFVGLFALALFFEYVAALTLYPKGLALFAAVGVGLGGLFLLAGRRTVVLALTGLYLVGLVLLRLVALSPVKPFRAFYEAVEPGMSKAEVLGELARRFPEGGRYSSPAVYEDGPNLWWTLDPADGEYDSEFVRVELADELAVDKGYYPD